MTKTGQRGDLGDAKGADTDMSVVKQGADDKVRTVDATWFVFSMSLSC
jgi:hypothetical protein